MLDRWARMFAQIPPSFTASSAEQEPRSHRNIAQHS